MKLSEAIRLGAMLRPQAFGYFAKDLGAGVVVSCALGAAAEALGAREGADVDEMVDVLRAAFPTQLDVQRPCPVRGCRVRRIAGNLIAHLNDDHRWTREQIAEWVERIEIASPPATVGASQAVDASDPHVTHPGKLTPRV